METYLILIIVFSAIGIINTIYLSRHAITKAPVKCIAFPKHWCETVQYSKYSKTFGIPNAFAGLGFYTVIFVLAFLFAAGTVPFWPIAVVITIGFLFSIYFTIIQAFVLKAFCTWCVLSAIDFLVLFIAMLIK